TIGGYNSMFHHNLWACNTGRNPSVGMNGDFNFVNNVIFNWRHRTCDGGDDVTYFNIINNYFKPGPITPADQAIAHRILKPEARRGRNQPQIYGKAYVAGNVVVGNEQVTNDNWAGGVQFGASENDKPEMAGVVNPDLIKQVHVDKPFPMATVTTQSAEQAYESVLSNAGATLPKRDPVDVRIIEEVRSGTVT